jgi:hypothetical protein
MSCITGAQSSQHDEICAEEKAPFRVDRYQHLRGSHHIQLLWKRRYWTPTSLTIAHPRCCMYTYVIMNQVLYSNRMVFGMILTPIGKFCLNLGWETKDPDWSVSWFSSISPSNCRFRLSEFSSLFANDPLIHLSYEYDLGATQKNYSERRTES